MADEEYDDVPGQLELPLGTPAPDGENVPAKVAGLAPVKEKVVSELGALRDKNMAKFQALERMGGRPDPAGLTMLRLNVLIDALFSDDGKMYFELDFERAMTPVLDACLAEMRQRLLTAGNGPGNAGPGLFIPPR